MSSNIAFDRREQLEKIQSGLLPGEQVLAVYDAKGTGTGFIGLTDRRAILQDNSFVGKKIALTSIPYSKISSVSMVTNKSFAGSFFSSSEVAIHVGTQTYQIEMRDDQKGRHVHDLILHYIMAA
ncbi:PH domain-containing protein [Streptodolium elevatio]|uniref:PH domain-containing protein n=1 Tax=Streptodolium elevatio TaxID=3157996 RepID=A0ABV3DUC2_9ACTN